MKTIVARVPLADGFTVDILATKQLTKCQWSDISQFAQAASKTKKFGIHVGAARIECDTKEELNDLLNMLAKQFIEDDPEGVQKTLTAVSGEITSESEIP